MPTAADHARPLEVRLAAPRRWRPIASDLVILAGSAAIVCGVYLLGGLPAALIVGGAMTTALGFLLGGSSS